MRRIHALPVGDLEVHAAQSTCWCHPTETSPQVWVHNAKDCREVHERFTGEGKPGDNWVCIAEEVQLTPDTSLPPLDPNAPRRKMLVEIEVSADFEKRLDNQWMVEREINADRWSWRWAGSLEDTCARAQADAEALAAAPKETLPCAE